MDNFGFCVCLPPVRIVMRLLLEQVSEERKEIRTINLRFFALIEVTGRQRELMVADRLKNEVNDLQQLVDEHLKDKCTTCRLYIQIKWPFQCVKKTHDCFHVGLVDPIIFHTC